MSEVFVVCRKNGYCAIIEFSQGAFVFLNTRYVKISRTPDRIYIIGCEQKDFASKKVSTAGNRPGFVSIGGLVTSGDFPRDLLTKKRIPATPCICNGKRALYIKYR